MLAGVGREPVRKSDVEEGGLAGIGHEHHVAAFASIAAGGTPVRNVFLPAKRDATIAAVPGNHPDLTRVDELHGPGARSVARGRPSQPRRPALYMTRAPVRSR
jgi:hypothetical protein